MVGHVGRLAPEKNLTFLAQAVSKALQKQPEAVFLMVGHGPSAEPIREYLEAQGLNHRVFMPGSLTGRNLADAYHAMNLFAFASRTETQGMVLTEAMAAGVPVVGLDAPGVREVVTDQVNGLLVGEEDATLFGEALDEALQWTPAQRRQRQQAARKTAEQFAMPSCAERLLMAYQNARERLTTAHGPEEDTLWQRSIDLINAEWQLWTNMAGALGEAINTTDASGETV
ncbi:MAG: glycosyltransferase family 4 protein [Phycisphaeraceae bacterium]|nr:glycosyltransferase family 4 protein [Phycisphaeraceae bacterium]